MICVSPSELKIIIDIFKKHIPRGEVRAFGSRYKWTCKDYSDLDIAIDIGRPMTTKELGAIEEDFIESDLPYRVDVLDYNGISKEFRAVIDKGCEVVYRELGWEKVRLEDFISFNPTERIVKRAKTKKIAMEKLTPFAKFINEYEVVEFNGGAKFRNGDTLLARITPCLENGKTSQVTILDNEEVGFGSTEFIVLRAKTEISDKDFIYYLSISPQFRDIAIQSMVGSSGRQRVQQSVLNSTVMKLPQLPEQKRIANILSALDDKIELNNRINKNLEAQAQAIFKSWFVDFEPFLEGEFEDSELGKIPKGWRVGRLGEIATITMGQSPKGDTYNENGKGTVFYQGRAEFGTRFPKCRLFTTAPNRMANENDILLSVRAPVGDYNIATESCCIGRGLAAIKPLNQTYSYCICLMSELQPKFNQFNAEGTVFGSINKDSLNGICVIIPDDSTLLKFEKLGSSLNDQIRSNYNNTQILATLRDTLLPKLMSGELLPDSLRKLEDSPCL